MKKALSLLLAFALTFPMCFGLISCGNANNPSDDNPSANNPNGDNPSQEPFSVDLAGYVANIGNATALGISKKAKASVSPMASYGTNNSGIQLLSYNTLASEKDTEDKNYIVMSTPDYDANAPEADKTGLTKVTFTKIVTENVTTETTGTKYIIANEGTISISATEGFKYTVYHNDGLIYNEVQDNDANDKNLQLGIIVLDNLIDGIEYEVKYKGIGVETTILQDDIDGEIDKLYVLNGYTFISFVPTGTSQRPEDQMLEYDNFGIAVYDKCNYSSSNSRQSFVIDNKTGYVYHIKDIAIDEIKNNLLLISGKIYDMRVTDDGELQFYTVVKNETLTIYNFFKDIYGNIYIENDYLDVLDTENNTLYYKHQPDSNASNYLKEYKLSKENYVIKINHSSSPCSAVKMGPAFSEEIITQDDCFYIDRLMLIKDGYLYDTRNFRRYNLITNTTLKEDYSSTVIFEWNEYIYDFVDYETIIIYCKPNAMNIGGVDPKTIFYLKIFGSTRINDCQNSNEGLAFKDAILLLENAEIEHIGDTFTEWKFKKITISETIYYQIVLDGNGTPKVVNSETYVAPPQDIISLQPINR